MGRWMIQGVLDLAVPAPTVGLPEPFLEIRATDLSILDHWIFRLFFSAWSAGGAVALRKKNEQRQQVPGPPRGLVYPSFV